jgi:hypothetical protein
MEQNVEMVNNNLVINGEFVIKNKDIIDLLYLGKPIDVWKDGVKLCHAVKFGENEISITSTNIKENINELRKVFMNGLVLTNEGQ